MKALVWHGKEDISCDTVSDPESTLATALHRHNPKRHNAVIATALVFEITSLELVAYAGVKAVHRRELDSQPDYSNRSGGRRVLGLLAGLPARIRDAPDYLAEGTVATAPSAA